MTRDEAIKEVNKAFDPAFANYIITALTEGATMSDKHEPTRKKGEWIMNSDFPNEIICSCCNCNYDMWFWEQMNYCPNCGSYMKGE